LEVGEGVDRWLEICEKIGRDGRETVEPETLKEYRRRADVMKEYSWTKSIPELEPPDIVRFRTGFWRLRHGISLVARYLRFTLC
jgi:integrase